jgi:hypothetical protein
MRSGSVEAQPTGVRPAATLDGLALSEAMSMLQLSTPEATPPPPEPTHSSWKGAARHLRIWLALRALGYGAAAREAFASAHPSLFGRSYWVTLHGYERWLTRHSSLDSVEAFALYLAPRHERWLATQPRGAHLPPCLIGVGPSNTPCWADGD